MHIKDHNDAMKFFRTYDNVASKGKWKEFVDEMEFESMIQKPRATAQEPRIGLQGGQLVQNTADGSRPGYGGPGKDVLGRDKVLTYFKDKTGKKNKPAYSIAKPTGDFKKWYDQNYTKKWGDLIDKKGVMTRYLQKVTDVPEGYITPSQYGEKYKFPFTDPKSRAHLKHSKLSYITSVKN